MLKARVARLAYTAALYLATPAILAYLLYRSLRAPAYRRHWAERFALYSGARAPGPTLWLHAVSVGETHAAQSLVAELARRYPDHALVMTHMTPTGRAAAERLYGTRLERVYLPYDYPDAVARFLARYQPRLGLIMETELWPNLFAAARMRDIPMLLVNARLSPRSLAKGLRHRALARATLETVRVLAQTEADAARLGELGARRVEVTGNLKFDVEVPPGALEQGAWLRARFGARRVLLLASTRPGEEQLVCSALAGAALADDVLIVIVPRHPDRFEEVALVLERARLTFQRRSALTAPGTLDARTRVVLGDSMGEMFAYCKAADVTYMGGGLLPFGTHNLIEPCAVGCPVIVGAHTFNFAEAATAAIEAGAALRVADAAELLAAAAALLDDPERRAEMGRRALAFSVAHRGATARCMAAVVAALSVPTGR